jgi:hypothetical protein
VAEWKYRIQQIEIRPNEDLDDQITTVLQDNGTRGWELVQILHRSKESIYRLIFKTEKPFLYSGTD